jgi:AraC-like DNA-binding protein
MLLAGGSNRSLDSARAPTSSAGDEIASNTSGIGWEQRVFSAAKIAHVVDALSAEGVAPEAALRRTEITPEQSRSPEILISVNQVIECYRNAIQLTGDPHFAFKTGLNTHLALYGMYGFAILSSMNFRETMQFAVRYHELATPLVKLRFSEEAGLASWTIDPLPHPAVEAQLYRFIIEMQFGVHVSLQRDVMGSTFRPSAAHLTYEAPRGKHDYEDTFGCPVAFRQSANCLQFDSVWLDRTPPLGNEIAYSTVIALCDGLQDQLRNRLGVAGKVRSLLLANLGRHPSLDDVSLRLEIPVRTLRRKLQGEHTSFRDILDQLRAEVAIKYLRDTKMTIDDIARALGFSETANLRHAFRRWNETSPLEYRRRISEMQREVGKA